VQEGRALGEELGERDGPGGAHARGGEEEPLKRGIEGECRAEGLNLHHRRQYTIH
jgi:hypothetical protein